MHQHTSVTIIRCEFRNPIKTPMIFITKGILYLKSCVDPEKNSGTIPSGQNRRNGVVVRASASIDDRPGVYSPSRDIPKDFKNGIPNFLDWR